MGRFISRSGLVLRIYSTLAVLVAVIFAAPRALAETVSADQAERMVSGWLQRDSVPLEAPLGTQITAVQTFTGDDGGAAYYVVYLDPSGFVIVPASDLIEPIIAFAAEGRYVPGLDNPLGAMIASDVPARLAAAQELEAVQRSGDKTLGGTAQAAQDKWQWLASPPASNGGERGLTSISDPRISPLTTSHWNQTTAGGSACYNYYTPPNAAGSSGNYPSGCVATATAQLMRYHQHPTAGVGTASFSISVCGTGTTRALRGGDGAGGPYVWSDMVLVPGSGTTTAQRQAIGALCHDAGVVVSMDYCSGGSGSDTLAVAGALRLRFGYSNARNAWASGAELPAAARNRMANAGLDAHYPVIFGITGSAGGHAIVGDGYGYNGGTLYHHLNMGWSGASDAWYNLPNIDSSPSFTTLYKCIYNVYVTGTGEIISGRVLDPNGTPLSGANVTAGSYSATSDSRGIYALAKIPSNTQYTINVTKDGYSFQPQTVSTGTSSDYSTNCGNLWGVDFAACAGPAAPTAVTADPNVACPGQSVTLTATGGSGGTLTWYAGGCGSGSAIGTGANIVVTAPAGATTYYVRNEGTCGNSICASATLAVNTGPAIGTQPGNQAACPGGSATFSVAASGTPAPAYQWRRGTSALANGGNISGATTASLTIDPVGPGDAATNYNCVVTSVCSTATSNNAALTINAAPDIGDQPAAQPLIVGGTAEFSVTANGTAPLAYQWQKNAMPLSNGGNITGATTATLTINPVAAGDAGLYAVVVTNACGQATSASASFWRPGDMNCDGVISFADINPFVLAMAGQAGYEARFPGCRYLNADINGDGQVSFADINPFVALLGAP